MRPTQDDELGLKFAHSLNERLDVNIVGSRVIGYVLDADDAL